MPIVSDEPVKVVVTEEVLKPVEINPEETFVDVSKEGGDAKRAVFDDEEFISVHFQEEIEQTVLLGTEVDAVVYEDVNGDGSVYGKKMMEDISVSDTGTVTITVRKKPDRRFAGKVLIR
jgi:hypothetical protein